MLCTIKCKNINLKTTSTHTQMTPLQLKPRQALNKAFLKLKPNRAEIELFKANLTGLLDRANDPESEEFHKNLVSIFPIKNLPAKI